MTRIALAFLAFISLPLYAIEIMPVDKIKPGMQGVGLTVFAGDTVEEFKFEVLDVIPNFRTKRDAILVKLFGEKIEHLSVAGGMSGSPMYIDGKLIGALAFQPILFQKDPVAGVTPIAEMLEIFDLEAARDEEMAYNRGDWTELVDMAIGASSVDIEALRPPILANRTAVDSRLGMKEISAPLMLSGFNNAGLALATGAFEAAGFEVNSGGSATFENMQGEPKPLQPGDGYAVVFVDGDLGLQATGTVTYVENGRVMGMGHPIFNSGAVGLPMARVKIITTLASLMSSTKMSTLTQINGSIHQDRLTGVMGIEGESARMIPVSLKIKSKFSQLHSYNFRVAADRSINSLTPFLFAIVINNALESSRMSTRNQTLRMSGQVSLKGREAVALENYFAGAPNGLLTDAIQAAGQIAATIGALLANSYETPEIESLELNFEVLPKQNLAFISKITADRATVIAGGKVKITTYIKEYQGKERQISHSLKIPEDINAKRIKLYVGSGATLSQLESRISPHKFRPKNFEQLIKIIDEQRQNNFVFFQVRQQDRSVTIAGEEMPGLPPSILSVIRSQRTSGAMSTTRERVILEEKVKTNYAVTGGKSLTLNVKPKN